MFAGLAPARRRLVVALLAVSLAAGITLAVAAVVGHDRAAPADQAVAGPVVLVPGYGGSAASLQSLADALRAAGRDATVVELPGDGTGDLEVAAGVLGATVQAVRDRTGAATVDVVGYSAGGVVARAWIAGGGAGAARRVLTLGSPHHGTTLVELAGSVSGTACPVACRQLAPGSDLIRRLNAGDETPAGPTWVSIWTTQDTTVTPPESARLDGALNLTVQSVCADAVVAHGDLPRAPVVQAMVAAALAAGDPPALTATDCARLRRG
ncbi:esterase/lipase family protein [Nakamurella deserti]|uniref:esterase/lipase family protein n=1 Tax=Nakamurella deserti TaxID=2164074 RepID=UPI000DBE0051|nr:alpha/beta fold hydrolase [Nakamurella deserti]